MKVTEKRNSCRWAIYSCHRHNLRFCKTVLQTVFCGETVCKTVLRRILKTQFMPVGDIDGEASHDGKKKKQKKTLSRR